MTDPSTEAIKARAEAAEAKLAEIERERDAARNRADINFDACQRARTRATTALAQVETLRKALDGLNNAVSRYLDQSEHYFNDSDYDRDGVLADRHAELTVVAIPAAEAALAATPAQEGETGEPQFYLRKNGYYYRPNARGYTTYPTDAGRFSEQEAKKHVAAAFGEVTMHPVQTTETK